MTQEHVAAAEQVWHDAHSAVRDRFHLPLEPRTAEAVRWMTERIGYVLATDPAGSWVAVDAEGRVVGLAQALLRDEL